jgi:SAM-dependent methyltransferase
MWQCLPPLYLMYSGQRAANMSGLFSNQGFLIHLLSACSEVRAYLRDDAFSISALALVMSPCLWPSWCLTGEVVGVERDANTLMVARSRVAEAQLRNVSFVETDVSHVASKLNGKPFDAVVGRLILFFVPNPGAVLRSLAKLVRPGGIIAIQEVIGLHYFS